ncbi:MAG: ATP synthase F1 subunit epsilon [Nitrospinota bacterium]
MKYDLDKKFHLTIVTPRREIFDDEVVEATFLGIDGDFGILKGHSQFISTLRIGPVHLNRGSHPETILLAGGYAEVLAEKTLVLATDAFEASDIDLEEVKDSKSTVEKNLSTIKLDDPKRKELNWQLELLNAKIEYIRTSKY